MDTSAVIAILTGEPGGDALAEALESATPRLIPAPALVELGIVLEARYGTAGGALVERFARAAEPRRLLQLRVGEHDGLPGALRR